MQADHNLNGLYNIFKKTLKYFFLIGCERVQMRTRGALQHTRRPV